MKISNNQSFRGIAALIFAFIFMLGASAATFAQTTEFTYQGRFTDTSVAQPTSGAYTMTFRLYDAATGGTQVVTNPTEITATVSVVNGLFTTRLDFGAAAFNTTAARYLEIQVGATALTPRQEITSAPFSQRALNAANAERLGGVAANQFVQTTDSRLSDSRTPTAGSASYIQNGTTQQTLSNFNISGTGTANSFAVRGGGTGLTLNDNFLRLRTSNDNNHGIVYNSAIDGIEFRANIGYRWMNGTSGATQRMALDGSGNLTVGNAVNAQSFGGNRFLARGGAPGGDGANNNGYAFSGNGGDNDSGLFSEANGRVSLYSDSLERLRVEGGTTTVTGNLAVSGTISGTLANTIATQSVNLTTFTVGAHGCAGFALNGGGAVGDLLTVYLANNTPAGFYTQPTVFTTAGSAVLNICNTLNGNNTFPAQNVRVIITRP